MYNLILREQLDTWNILLRARNEGRLFSRIEWPNDPEIVRIMQFLYLLSLLFGFAKAILGVSLVAEGAGEAAALASYSKGFCSKYSKKS